MIQRMTTRRRKHSLKSIFQNRLRVPDLFIDSPPDQQSTYLPSAPLRPLIIASTLPIISNGTFELPIISSQTFFRDMTNYEINDFKWVPDMGSEFLIYHYTEGGAPCTYASKLISTPYPFPSGDQVVLMASGEFPSSFYQNVYVPVASDNYILTMWVCQPDNAAFNVLALLVDGVDVCYIRQPPIANTWVKVQQQLSLTEGSHKLEIATTFQPNYDLSNSYTATFFTLIDSIDLRIGELDTYPVNPSTPLAPAITNGSFETPAITSGTQSNVAGMTADKQSAFVWTYTVYPIIENNYYAYPQPYPSGNQILDLFAFTTIQTTFQVYSTNYYILSLSTCQRTNAGYNPAKVYIDNVLVWTVPTPTVAGVWTYFETSLGLLTLGTHTIKIAATKDYNYFAGIDNINLRFLSNP